MEKNYSLASRILGLIICLTFLSVFPSKGQIKIEKGTTERVKVYGKTLEGNLSGDSPERDVSIYLPPSYKKDTKRRFPVVYFLHGFTDSDSKFFGNEPHWMNLPEVLNKVYASGNIQEMIIVTPNANTRFFGSMYSNSITVGNWEEFIATELVSFIDNHYRTIPHVSSRGLAGHSMGGYGTFRIGEKYPNVFSSLYLLSPCCLGNRNNTAPNDLLQSKLEAIKSYEDLKPADFFVKAMFASAAAWSPNPQKPPFFLDLPMEKGEIQPLVLSKWSANSPLVTFDQHIFNIKKIRAFAFDAGNEDKEIALTVKELDRIMNLYGIKHVYDEYDGNHINKVAERIETKMMNFFSENLSSSGKK